MQHWPVGPSSVSQKARGGPQQLSDDELRLELELQQYRSSENYDVKYIMLAFVVGQLFCIELMLQVMQTLGNRTKYWVGGRVGGGGGGGG